MSTARGRYMPTIVKDEKSPELSYWKFFNLNAICRSLDPAIKVDKLYNNFKGRYDSLDSDRERIFKLMKPIIQLFFERLGYNVSFMKIGKRDGE